MKTRTKGTTRNVDVLGEPRLGWFQQRAWDVWFAPKRFESQKFYRSCLLKIIIAHTGWNKLGAE
jgi:hypothetical protein